MQMEHVIDLFSSRLFKYACIISPQVHSFTGIIAAPLHGTNSEVRINSYQITGTDIRGCFNHSGNTGNTVLSGDDCTMYEHSAPSFDNPCSQRGKKCQCWIN